PRATLCGVLLADAPGPFPHAGAVLAVRDSAGELAYATLDADGAFTIEQPLSPGWASLRALGGEFAFARTMSSEMNVRIEEGEQTELELSTCEPTAVRGRLVDDRGDALAGVVVTQ